MGAGGVWRGPILTSFIPRSAFTWSSVGGEQMEVS